MQLKNISFDYGNKAIFKNINVTIQYGDKIGVVGVNGAGKSTLFKLILGELIPNTGEIILKKGTKIGFLPQVIAENRNEKETIVRDYILSARPIADLERRLDDIYQKMSNISESNYNVLLSSAQKIQEELENLDWYDYENIMLKIAYSMKVGEYFDVGNYRYQIKSISGKTGTVALVKVIKKKNTMKTATISATVSKNSYTFNVTSVAKNTFKKAKKLKRVNFGKYVTSIGANALIGSLGGAAVGTASGFAAAGVTTAAVATFGTASTGVAISSLFVKSLSLSIS